MNDFVNSFVMTFVPLLIVIDALGNLPFKINDLICRDDNSKTSGFFPVTGSNIFVIFGRYFYPKFISEPGDCQIKYANIFYKL